MELFLPNLIIFTRIRWLMSITNFVIRRWETPSRPVHRDICSFPAQEGAIIFCSMTGFHCTLLGTKLLLLSLVSSLAKVSQTGGVWVHKNDLKQHARSRLDESKLELLHRMSTVAIQLRSAGYRVSPRAPHSWQVLRSFMEHYDLYC